MPIKVIYEELEEDPDLEFEFFLADRLKLTVAEMRMKLTHAEYAGWQVFHARKAQRMELEMEKAKS